MLIYCGTLKMAAPRMRSVSKPDKNPNIEHSKSQVSQGDTAWAPSAFTSFKILLSARLCAAVWNIVGDCDETFNYWEPTHYLMFGKGFQTWEYSPKYAIRSYAYLWLHALPMTVYNALFSSNKVILFYILRCIFALVCALSEVYFYRGICKQFGANTGIIALSVLLLSAGMFISATAYLPSSFCMYTTFVSAGGWFLGHYPVAIIGTAAGAILGWPFSGIIGVPVAYDIIIRRKKINLFILWSGISLAVFLLPMVQIDYHYYGKLVIAPLNIVLYNVFTDHGPDLYGVEPFSFYFLNGFLNFNIFFFLALLCLPIVVFVRMFVHVTDRDIPLWLSILPMYLWIMVFFSQPHKEERFLFPIYPLIAVFGSVAVDYIQKLWSYLFPHVSANRYTDNTSWISISACSLFSILSIARIVAIYQGYHAPLDIYVELNKIASDPKIHTLYKDKPVNLCVGKEWYRYASSFFLPGDNWNLQFLRSEFRGQLPKPYASGADATKIIPSDMNDINKEEMSRYINISKCHYLIDLDLPQETKFEPRYSSQADNWKVLHTVKFLDASRSHKLFRAFYIPFVSHKFCTYVDYNIMKTTRTRKISRSKASS